MKFGILVLLLLMPLAAADHYYADVSISVEDNGLTTIEGETNHPHLLVQRSPELTSKKGSYWMLNVTHEGLFSNYVYELELPDHASINYLRTPSLTRIEDSGGRLRIIGAGSDKPFVIVVQYQIDRTSRKLPFVFLGMLLLLAAGAILWRKRPATLDDPALTDRQKDIVDVLKKGPLTQTQIQKKTGLPKSSVSRNIRSLEQKKIVQKTRKGMSNMISLRSG